ncbi:transcriptional repressor [Candidatus Curtissbacteria bacterium]|nr:transcriptional repressor [Candidatus Curtissbacteria bacterium]
MKNINTVYGFRRTRARTSILELLEKEKSPVDVQFILDRLSELTVSADPATVYRIMDAFYKKGIVERLELGEGKFRYEISKREHHHHFICENCGAIEDVQDKAIEQIEARLSKNRGLVVTKHCLEFYGLCRKCSR